MNKNFLKILSLATSLLVSINASAANLTLTNVSYDPTRELYEEYNGYFKQFWQKKTGQAIEIQQSHGGSAKQARSVIDGLEADIVTLALSYDIDSISEKTKLLSKDWQKRLPNNSSPYTSTIVFLVKKGNPKNIKDWNDLTNKGVQVITPSPKTSGGARWNYLALWGYAKEKFSGDENKIKEFTKKILDNVVIYDTGARGATITFTQRGIGDVLIAWENEALMTLTQGNNKDKYEIVRPSVSILAEPPVAVVDKIVEKHKTAEIANAYLAQLYSKEGQEIIAKNFYRPQNQEIIKKYASRFPQLKLVTINDFGGWEQAQKKHFDDGGVFDQLVKK